MTRTFAVRSLERQADSIQATVHVPVDLVFFEGHFPDDPILPGVTQVVLVGEVLRQVLGEGTRVQGLRRVKFTSPVRPGMDLDLHLTLRDPFVTWRLQGPEREVSFGEAVVQRGRP